jgi:hypothetical protein
MLMNMARWIATKNPIPQCSGKPAILFISLENEIYENLDQWFVDAYVNMFNQKPEGLSNDEIIDYVTKVYSDKGYSLLVYRKMQDAFGYQEYVSLVETIEQDGYTVVATLLDYLTLMKTDRSHGNDADAYQALAHNLTNYNKHKLITTVTGLQLDTEAARLAMSSSYVVKKFGMAHLKACKGLMQELDLAIFMHIESNHFNEKFVTLAWYKRRHTRGVPIKYKYTAYKFNELGIMDDVDNDEPSYVDDIYMVEDPNESDEQSSVKTSVF